MSEQAPKVSGSVVVVVLGVITVSVLAAIVVLSLYGKESVVLSALAPLLGIAVVGMINSLENQEIKHQTNGNTSRLIDTIQVLSTQSPVSPTPPGPITEQSPDGDGRGPQSAPRE